MGDVATKTKATAVKKWTIEDTEDLLDRAQRGDASTLPMLRKMFLDAEDKDLEPWGGDLAGEAERAFLRSIAGDNLLFREAIRRKLELLRRELNGPDPTPIERLLVERCVACWLQVQDAEIRYAQASASLEGQRLQDYQLRMDRSHRRYLSALKMLATVRKLALPVLQVNIGAVQTNVAGVAQIEGG